MLWQENASTTSVLVQSAKFQNKVLAKTAYPKNSKSPILTAKMLSTQSCSECKIAQQSSCKDSISKKLQVPNFNCKDAFDTDSEN